MTRIRLTLALLVTLFLVGGTTACDTILGPDDITGTYSLQTVNGEEMPWVEEDNDDYRFEITSITITLDEGTTCSIVISWKETFKADNTTDEDSETISCTYATTDSAITISITEDGETETLSGTIDGDTLTITDDGDTLVFEK